MNRILFIFFLNYKSTGMNITNYVDTVFKYKIITLKKTALYPVLVNVIPGTVFYSLTCQHQL